MKKRIITISILTSLCLFGCGKVTEDEKELAEFSTSMSTFTESIKEANTKINELDSSDKDSVKELLNILDDMDKDFLELLDKLREQAGIPLILNCAYRSKEWDFKT